MSESKVDQLYLIASIPGIVVAVGFLIFPYFFPTVIETFEELPTSDKSRNRKQEVKVSSNQENWSKMCFIGVMALFFFCYLGANFSMGHFLATFSVISEFQLSR